MAILLKKLAAAVREYDRTQPERDALWESIWTLLDPGNSRFNMKEFEERFAAYEAAEEAARRKLGEAMWAEPTNSNSYDHCVNLITIGAARNWIKTTVEEYEQWCVKHAHKFAKQYDEVWPKSAIHAVKTAERVHERLSAAKRTRRGGSRQARGPRKVGGTAGRSRR